VSIIVAGIHTGIGKTVCSAILCQKLGYDYFKPVQAGDLEQSDSIFVGNSVTNLNCIIHPEIYKLQIPASPHYAAEQEGIEIIKENFLLPETKNNIIIETAGGVMSPLSANLLNLDLIEHFGFPTILVSQNYLGSINHTLLSFEALKSRNINILGIVFNGMVVPASEEYILGYTNLKMLFRLPEFKNINSNTITDFCTTLKIDF